MSIIRPMSDKLERQTTNRQANKKQHKSTKVVKVGKYKSTKTQNSTNNVYNL